MLGLAGQSHPTLSFGYFENVNRARVFEGTRPHEISWILFSIAHFGIFERIRIPRFMESSKVCMKQSSKSSCVLICSIMQYRGGLKRSLLVNRMG